MDIIDKIRRERGVGIDIAPDSDIGKTIAFYQKATHTSSEELSDKIYTKAAHFVLEFVQNSDDNVYHSAVTPELIIDFDVKNGLLTISTNEKGFTEQDVRSICDLGESTKKGSQDSIGEKGLGFKSVFKVANSVFISSREFRFKLQRATMLIPEWDETYATLPGYTVFRIPIAHRNDRDFVADELRALQPTILLFLRKLRRLVVTLDGSSRTFSRTDDGDFIHLSINDSSQSYLIERKEMVMDPNPQYRPKSTRTEIVLAFPVEQHGSPKLPVEQQNVHAFLPLRAFGFSFIIQADFITTTNREDIQENLQWNITLRNAVSLVVVDAIEKMRNRSSTRYSWLAYLKFFSLPSFFKPIYTNILQTLGARPIIKTSEPRLRVPKEVVIRDFLYRSQPVLPQQFLPGNRAYLSEDYSICHFTEELESLGVRTMSDRDLVEGLRSYGRYTVQPAEWQDTVASFLAQVKRRRQINIDHLVIVPMADGTWSQIRECSSLFFDSADGAHIPADLLRHVERLPLTSSRYRLFESFGTKKSEPENIASKIYDLHSGGRVSSCSALMEHAKYLFTNRDSIRRSGHLRVYDRSRDIVSADSIYMDDTAVTGDKLSSFLGDHAQFLHDDYLSAFAGSYRDRDWLEWLQKFGIAVKPRLGWRGKLSNELSGFFDRAALSIDLSRQALQMLKQYQSVLRDSQPALDQLRDYPFMCTDSGLPFLPVDEPLLGSWDLLADLGVSIRPDGIFWLKLLKRLQATNQHPTIPEVTAVYKQLNCFIGYDLRDTFYAKPLILVADEQNLPRWISVNDCTWRGPRCMRTKYALKVFYPDMETFFTEIVGVCKQPEPKILVAEMERATTETALPTWISTVTEIAREISYQIAESTTGTPSWISDLAKLAIFPVISPGNTHATLMTASASFYIPDRRSPSEAEAFSSSVPLLCQDWTAGTFKPLLTASPFKDRLKWLGDSINTVYDFGDSRCTPDSSSTERYHNRLEFILAECHDKWGESKFRSNQRRIEMLQNLTVYRAHTIQARHSLDDHEISTTTSQLVVLSGDSASRQVNPDGEAQKGFLIVIAADCSAENDYSHEYRLFSKALAPRLALEVRALYGIMSSPLALLAEDLDIDSMNQALTRANSDSDWDSPSVDSVAVPVLGSRVYSRTSSLSNSNSMTRIRMSKISQVTVDKQAQAEKDEFQRLVQHVKLAAQNSDTTVLLDGANSYELSSEFGRMTLAEGAHSQSANVSVRTTDTLVLHMPPFAPLQARLDIGTDSQQAAAAHSGGATSGPRSESVGLIPRASLPPSQYERDNGILGEIFAFHFLKSLLPGFTEGCWKSEFRSFLGFDECVPGVADFEYTDKEGTLTTILFGEERRLQWSGASESGLPTYHIEVKSTSSGVETPFHMSSAQLLSAASMRIRSPSTAQPEIYVILRVANIRSETPRYRFLPDPHRMLYDEVCSVVSDVQIVVNN